MPITHKNSRSLKDHHIMKIIMEGSSLLIILIVYLFITTRYWRKWGDIILDYSREIYIPWQLSCGKVLYRDIDYVNGPLAPYINTIWFKLSGVSINNLFIFNLIITFILTYIIYKIIIKVCDRITATLSCLMLLIIFAFSFSPTYNFISPYDHNLTYGFFFSVLMIYYVFNYQYRPQLIKIACAGFCLGLVFLTKAELFLAAIMTVIIAMTITQKVIKLQAHSLHLIIITLLGSMLVPVLFFLGYFSSQMPFNQALHAIVGNWYFIFNSPITKIKFYQILTGFDEPVKNILLMLLSFIILIDIFTGGFIIEFIKNGRFKENKFGMLTIILVFGVLLFLLFFAKIEQVKYVILSISRGLPLISLSTVALSCFLFRKSEDGVDKIKSAQLIIWSLFGFFLLGKIILNSTFRYYGFVLTIPAMLSIVMLTVWLVPKLLIEYFGKCLFFRTFAIIGLTIFLLVIFFYTDKRYSGKDQLVGKGSDIFYVYDPPEFKGRARLINQMVTYIETSIPAQASLLVLPEGAMINYLTRRPSPIPLISFTPGEIAAFGETYILNSLKEQSPDFILLVHRPTTEFGIGFFGTDPNYGKRIMDWVTNHYTSVIRIGSEPLKDNHFGMKLLKLISH